MLPLVLPLLCLEVHLEFRPGFLFLFLIVPLVIVIVEQACVVNERVNRVNNIFVGDRTPSIVRKFLDLLDSLYQFLERPVRAPQLQNFE